MLTGAISWILTKNTFKNIYNKKLKAILFTIQFALKIAKSGASDQFCNFFQVEECIN